MRLFQPVLAGRERVQGARFASLPRSALDESAQPGQRLVVAKVKHHVETRAQERHRARRLVQGHPRPAVIEIVHLDRYRDRSRSEERRVGKEWRSLWGRDDYKEKRR